jgi:hypothetical protein
LSIFLPSHPEKKFGKYQNSKWPKYNGKLKSGNPNWNRIIWKKVLKLQMDAIGNMRFPSLNGLQDRAYEEYCGEYTIPTF